MSSREIADLTGKQHKNVTVDIVTMLTELKEDVLSFQRIYRDSMNREQTEYHLDRELTETLLTGYSAVLRRNVLRRWHVLEAAVKTKAKAISATQEFKSFFGIAKLLGLDRNVCAISANQATLKLTGTNVLQLLGHTALVNPEQTIYYTPTQLGAMQEPALSPQNINRKLAALGLQQHVETKSGGMWAPTGKAHGLYQVLDTGKSHNSGAMVQQIKWSKAALEGGAV